MIKKIFNHSGNKNKAALAAAGSIIGLVLMLLSMQIFQDFRQIFSAESDFFDSEYLILKKEVNIASSLTGSVPSFDDEEILDIGAQDFVKECVPFSRGNFEVYLQDLSRGGTVIFLEAIPDRFIDVQPTNWKWNKGEDVIPIILPTSFLDAYNFGVAPSSGQPPLTLSLLKTLSPTIIITGNGYEMKYKGRIVDLSDRITSFLVPQDFLDYANQTYGTGEDLPALRTMISTPNTKAPELVQYIEDNGYATNKDAISGKDKENVVNTFTWILFIMGLLIVSASALSFLLYAQLTIYKSKKEINTLLIIGYKYQDIAKEVFKYIGKLYLIIILGGALLSLVGKYFLNHYAQSKFGFELPELISVNTAIIGLLFMATFIFLTLVNLKREVKKMANSIS